MDGTSNKQKHISKTWPFLKKGAHRLIGSFSAYVSQSKKHLSISSLGMFGSDLFILISYFGLFGGHLFD